MGDIVPSARTENLFYLACYNNSPISGLTGPDSEYLHACIERLSNCGRRAVRCDAGFLSEQGVPECFIDYLRSKVWGELVQAGTADILVGEHSRERTSLLEQATEEPIPCLVEVS